MYVYACLPLRSSSREGALGPGGALGVVRPQRRRRREAAAACAAQRRSRCWGLGRAPFVGGFTREPYEILPFFAKRRCNLVRFVVFFLLLHYSEAEGSCHAGVSTQA